MLLIAAALAEELQVVLELCPPNGRLAIQGVRGWKAMHGSLPIVALKTGMGPARAANSLKLFLSTERPARTRSCKKISRATGSCRTTSEISTRSAS